jgi:hypothetical protein
MEPGWVEAVRLRAYYLWDAQGRPDGRALEHWIAASHEVAPPDNVLDPLTSAESILTLLSGLNARKLPSEERMAVSQLQLEALDEWLSAYLPAATRAED